MHPVGVLLRQWRHLRRISQMDLALAAGISTRHVSLVETGRSNPSADMVLRISEQLDVPLRARNQLLLAAGFAPRYPERELDGEALAVAREAVERVLQAHEPYPALVLDRRWNIVAANRGVLPFFAVVAPELLEPPVNMVRLGLHPRGFAPLVVNMAVVRAVLRSRITRQLATAPDEELAALYQELLAPDGDEPMTASAESDVVIPMVFRLDGRELRLFSTTTTFGTPLDVTLAEVAIESYYPADIETAEHLRALDRRHGGEAAPALSPR
jgi:transcriptional regulator with XRE-family HTH domain